jgi:outer membrane receptor protein involved in Fe transport
MTRTGSPPLRRRDRRASGRHVRLAALAAALLAALLADTALVPPGARAAEPAVAGQPAGAGQPAVAGEPAVAPAVTVEGGVEIVRPPPERPLPSQAAQAGARIVITREQFQESQKTVADVLADQGGVTLTRSGDLLAPAKVTLRGSRADQVLVIVDGVPQNAETDHPAEGRLSGRQGVDLTQIGLADVESIEIVRGAAGGLYGPGAAAGAIVIRTRRPREREFSADHTVGSGGYVESGVAGAEPFGGTTVTYAARNRVSDGHYVYFDPNAARQAGGAPNPCAQSAGGGYFVRTCDRTEISTATLALLQGAQRRIALDWQDYDRHGLGGIQDPRPFGRERRTRTGLTYGDGAQTDGGHGWTWLLAAAEVDGHRTDNEQAAAGVLENRHVEEARSAEAWWLPPAGAGDESGSAHPSALPAAETAASATAPAAPLRLGAGAGRLSLRDEFFAAQRDTGWLAAQWNRRWERTILEAAVRADSYSDVAGQETWRLAGSQTLARGGSGESFGLKAGAGTGYRPPSLYELYDPGSILGASAANPRLKPEQSQSQDAGVYADWPERFYGELLDFEQDFRNTVALVADPASPALFRFENLTRTRSTGYEALATWKPTRGLTLSVNYTRIRAVLLDNDAIDPRDNGKQVPGIPTERGSAELAWRREGWSVYAKARSSAERFVDTANSRALRPYTVWDAGIGVPLPRGFEASLDARNLTSETYAEVDNYPAPGRQVFLTLRWRLGAGAATPTLAPPPSQLPALPAQAPRAAEAPAGP